MLTQNDTHFWATCKTFIIIHLLPFSWGVFPTGPELSELIIRFFVITLWFDCFLFFLFILFLFSTRNGNRVVYLWNSTHDYRIMQAERQLSRIQWSVHIIQSEMQMWGICTFAGVNFLHESVPLESKNLRLKFYFFSNSHGQSWNSRQLTRFTASVNSVNSWFRSVPVVSIRL